MADTDATIVIGLELDDGTTKQITANVNDLAEKIGQSLRGQISGGIDKSFTGLIVQFQAIAKVASAAFGVVSDAVSTAITESNQAEQSLTKLSSALANTGQFSQQAVTDIQALAASMQRVGTVGDDAVIEGAAALVAIGNIGTKELPKATQAAVDLAASGVDLQTSFDLVAKAAAGNTATLSRYGIVLDKNIPESQKFGEVLRLINERFGGLDAARANTFEGAITKVKNAVSDFYESLGNIITQSPSIVAVIKFIADQIGRLTGSINELGKQPDPFKSVILGAIDFAQTLTNRVIPVLTFLKDVAVTVFNVLKTGFQAVVAGAGNLGFILAQVLNTVGIVSDDTVEQFATFAKSSNDVLVDLANNTRQNFSDITDSAIGLTESTPAVDAFWNNMREKVETAAAVTDIWKNKTGEAVDASVAKMSKGAQAINDAIKNGIINSISQGVQALTNALIKGGNAFQAFGLAVLGIIGDMAIQIGTTLIGIGLGMEAIRASIIGLTGGPALFAGLALVALGTLLKSLSGGGGAGGGATQTTGTAPGGVAQQPDTVGDITQQPGIERDRKTAVTINVQGNILDRRESGLELASVLQEYFDTNDGVVART